ncbi:hypothetical protein AB4124_04095 [Paenibacillus sp. 2KB_20]|uniref:hypothetical protein n=1 Tax=Paenibacillus sp. 2KB_20 TaxID=3232977 RepID=UPI003F94E3C1
MFFTEKKIRENNIRSLESLIEAARIISEDMYADLLKRYSTEQVKDADKWRSIIFLTSLGTGLLNDSFAFNVNKIENCLDLLGGALNQEEFDFVTDYLKYISTILLTEGTNDELIYEYLGSWLFMSINQTDNFVKEKTPPYMFAGTLIYKTFNNFLDNNHLQII